MGETHESVAHHVDEVVGVSGYRMGRSGRVVIGFVMAVHGRRRDTPGPESEVVHDVEVAVLVVSRVALAG